MSEQEQAGEVDLRPFLTRQGVDPAVTWLDQCAWRIASGIRSSYKVTRQLGHIAADSNVSMDACIAERAYDLAKAMLAEKQRIEGGAK